MTPVQAAKESVDPRFGEFVALMALLIALVALATDIMLPALPAIGADLGVRRANDAQLIVSTLFLGLAVGQLFYGPVSDNVGRKPAIYAGLGLFGLGSVLAVVATNFPIMLLGRLLQGLGVAGPRSVTVALIRDRYEGRRMARVLSFVMGVFILSPVIAPSIGQLILFVTTWRAIFAFLLLIALIAFIWLAWRQPETLPAAARRPFEWRRLARAFRHVLGQRVPLGYTVAAGLVTGAFLGYLNSAQQIFQELYGLGARFPLVFAVLALSVGAASFTNARLVLRHGMRALSNGALRVLAGLSVLFLAVTWLFAGAPPLSLFMGYLLAGFFCIGILFGNLNALAMEPLGHVAGVGAAVVGALSTLLAVPLGIVIGQSYDGTVWPLIVGFATLAIATIGVLAWTERPPAT